jgi:IS5 family transposase
VPYDPPFAPLDALLSGLYPKELVVAASLLDSGIKDDEIVDQFQQAGFLAELQQVAVQQIANGGGLFSKKRGLAILDMVKSTWVYKQLKNFRAGIEANISHLKRSFGLRRCNWSGWDGFQQYVWSSVVSYNLLALARQKLKDV